MDEDPVYGWGVVKLDCGLYEYPEGLLVFPTARGRPAIVDFDLWQRCEVTG